MSEQPNFLDPQDTVERENEKLRKITAVLMRRVEQDTQDSNAGYAHFQRAILLEDQVRARTRDLEDTLEQLNDSNARLSAAIRDAEQARSDLSNALEAIYEGFAIFDPDDRLVMSNSRFCAYLPDVRHGLKPGTPFKAYIELVSRSSNLVLPEHTTPSQWKERRIRNHRRQHVNFTVQMGVDRWVQVSEQRTPDGGTAIIQTDVTEMIRLERVERDKLLDHQSRLVRATLDHINQGVCIFDADNRLIGWNERVHELISPSPQLLRKGCPFVSLVDHIEQGDGFSPDEGLKRLRAWVGRRSGRQPFEAELHRPDGLILDLFCQDMPDHGFVISFTDVTAEREAIAAMHRANETLEQRVAERTRELLQARDQAEQANASKSRFVAAASHDLLQPINAAKLFISSLLQTDLQPQQRETAGRIQKAFDSVESILGALLDISKLDSGGASADVRTFPLSSLFSPLRDEFGALAAQKGIGFRVVDSSLHVRSDAAYLRRILQNLAANAVRYTPKGKVLIGARYSGESVRLEVRDTGPGIPNDKLTEIFEEFRRLSTAGDGSSSMGLGLAIVERACKLLGHGLKVHSELGRGSCFSVDVPVGEPAAAALGGQPGGERPAAARSLDGVIALVLENDDEVRQGMISLLEHWGGSALDAPDLPAAMALISEIGLPPDVILADFHLGQGDNGIDAIEAVRALYGKIPAFVITADRSPAIEQLAARSDIQLFYKPLEPDALRSRLIDTVLAGS